MRISSSVDSRKEGSRYWRVVSCACLVYRYDTSGEGLMDSFIGGLPNG